MDYRDMDSDSLFARLEELYSKLEYMQQKEQGLVKARKAHEIAQLSSTVEQLEGELSRYEMIRDQALIDANAANASGDRKTEGQNLAMLRMFTDLYATRLSTLQRAQQMLRDAFSQASLSPEDPLEKPQLSEEELAGLEKEISDYREEYLAVYQACKEHEADS